MGERGSLHFELFEDVSYEIGKTKQKITKAENPKISFENLLDDCNDRVSREASKIISGKIFF